ncbi:DinB family protein [Nocardioides panacis]|uniref:DinB family protein n=2 Tax=Nocardioides panacis TaxID=2849501 RepID=A0A975Y2E0_9ACTN|nr:DinB family protein [Nocardioides panacis]
MKCEGLTLEQLKVRPLRTSRLTLLGLVRHLTEVERGWFLPFLGEPVTELYCTEADPDGDFHGVPHADAEADLARYGETVDTISDRLRRHRLDEVEEDGGTSYNLRWIFTHMVEEYARHNGHADLLREAIDGTRGE